MEAIHLDPKGRQHVPDDDPILWILGAGASKHLDLPLLCEFHTFIVQVATHPDNQGSKDAKGRCASIRTVKSLLKKGINGDIEKLLHEYPENSNKDKANLEKAKDARLCIRWCFEKRHNAVMHKRDIPYKYAAYAYFLCCVKPNDTIVNFNYDLAIERTFFNANRTPIEHCKQPRIPEECLPYLDHQNGLIYPLAGVNNGGSKGVKLVKIHGSLSFKETCGNLVVGSERHEAVCGEPYIVYPASSKPGMQDGRENLLLEAAKTALQEANRIVIAGYSLPESDAKDHPFVKELWDCAKDKTVIIVSPKPSDKLLELVKKAHKKVVWVDKFESVFSDEHVQSFGKVVDLKLHLSS